MVKNKSGSLSGLAHYDNPNIQSMGQPEEARTHGFAPELHVLEENKNSIRILLPFQLQWNKDPRAYLIWGKNP